VTADTAVFYTAKGNVRLVIHRAAIYVGHTRLQTPGNGESLLLIPGDDTRRKAVFRVVGQSHGFINAFGGDNRCFRTDGFLLKNAHLGRNIGKHVRLVEKPLVAAAYQQFGTLLNRLGDWILSFFFVNSDMVPLHSLDALAGSFTPSYTKKVTPNKFSCSQINKMSQYKGRI
jgi:hypothetical protein